MESPAKAKTIGKYLGDDYEVTASMGHIRDLPASQLGIDVEHGYAPQYISIKGKEKLIKELKSKAKHAVEAAQMIVADYGGVVPADMKELVKLPGVGRKTANIVLNVGYGIVEGIAVDTHVNRIAHRLMLSPKTHAKEPLKTEQDLLKILPHEYWESVNHQWITFGREICDARKPKCDECPLADLCPSVRVTG